MRYNEWKLITESLQGTTTLGLARPHTVGGLMGNHLAETDFEDDDEDMDDDFDSEEDDDDDAPTGNPPKSFPPESSEDEMGTSDFPANHAHGSEEDLMALSGIDDDHGGDASLDGDAAMSGGDPTADPSMGDDANGFPDDMNATGEPCPDCNPEGTEHEGQPDCPTCGGMGFMPQEDGGDEMQPYPADDAALAPDEMQQMMHSYMNRYMRKESMLPMVQPQVSNVPQDAGMTPVAAKKMIKFMTKNGERSFMAADAPRKYMKKDDKKHCKCENSFLDSLAKQVANPYITKYSSGLREDALLRQQDPNASYESEPQAGQVGFAPQGRLGVVGGGGYTQADTDSIPVLGESTNYPTLAQYIAFKNRSRKK